MNTRNNILFGKDLREFISNNWTLIKREIDTKPDEYYEDVPKEEFIDYLISEYELPEFPEIHWEETTIDIKEVMIYGRNLPSDFRVMEPSKKFPFKEVTYHIPFTGEGVLFQYYSSNKIILGDGSVMGLSVSDNHLKLPMIDFRRDPKKLEIEFERSKKSIINKCHSVKLELDDIKKAMPRFIQVEIDKRITKINKDNDYKSQFKFPIKKEGSIPPSFQLPRVVKKKKIKPTQIRKSGEALSSERHISDEDFKHILSILQDCGKNWEQHPEIYKGKDEEALRDQLIFVLAPNIEGVVAGEAYNKKGKTDIAIKYESTNLFIGECKIWKGASVFTKTIDQILGYLTWRDSKSAIMMFVPNVNISAVVKTAQETVEAHPNFVRELEVVNNGWINYRFHLNGDEGSYLTIAVHLYHMPDL